MARTVTQGFLKFLENLTPTPGESKAAAEHRASIRQCLENNFSVKRFFETGSFGNDTSISGYSDVDYFVSIPRRRLKANSENTLAAVRDALDTRFPRTGVGVRCPAVRIPFGTAKETTEVVPADFMYKSRRGYRIYEIPDCNGKWMPSSPEAHNSYVTRIDTAKDYQVKPLVRFMKAWKYYQGVPISSFYLEIRVSRWASTLTGPIVYDRDVYALFSLLMEKELRRISDPMRISNSIAACSTEAKLETALSKLETAHSRARKAYDARLKGNTEEAFEWWDLLYNGGFPSY